MNKSLLLVVVIALASVGGLYSLPKVVVQDDKRAGATTQATSETTTETPATPPAGTAPTHENRLTAEQRQRIGQLRRAFETAPDAASKQQQAEALSAAWAQATQFDSAAYYAEELVRLAPTLPNYLRAADRYYEAFTFAIDEQKSKALGEKTRQYYQKALDENPNLLQAKSNLAMTYLSTSTPMQGIAMLREVLEQDPDFEPALFNLGILSMRSNQYQKAAERFERILRTNPGSSRSMFYLGISYAELGQKQKAIDLLERVRQTEKDPTIQAGVNEYLEKLKG
jgi:tetratricopeptide (TPR) repeat protein